MMPDPVIGLDDPPALDPPPFDAPPAVDPPPAVTVSDLLATSRRAHLLYHQESPRMVAVPMTGAQLQPGDPAAARDWLKQAAAARAQAELIDPTHSDPGWQDQTEAFPHQALLVFYLQQLSK